MVVLLFISLLGSLFIFSVSLSSIYSTPNRYSSAINYLFTQLNSLTPGFYRHLFTTLLISLLVLNLFGNIPGFYVSSIYYYFSSSLSLTFWLALIVVVILTQLSSFMAHMLPYGAPLGLMLFLPLIELFSHVIRPLTLIIRLSTNLSAGHIMMYIFSFFSLSSLSLTVGISLVLSLLFILELIISCLQAYIFSSLVLLYVSETL